MPKALRHIRSAVLPVLGLAVLIGVELLAQAVQSPQQLFEAGQNDKAMAAIAQQRSNGEAGPGQAYLAGQILLKGNQTDGARREFQTLAQAEGAWKLIGESALAALDGDTVRALDAAVQAVNASPDQFEAQYQLGTVRARQGDWGGSAAAFERATQMNATFAYAHYFAAQAFSKANRIDRAAEFFERFLKLAPAAPERAAVESVMRTLRGR
jgi:tetratricopeptide (TPR) repeat protein